MPPLLRIPTPLVPLVVGSWLNHLAETIFSLQSSIARYFCKLLSVNNGHLSKVNSSETRSSDNSWSPISESHPWPLSLLWSGYQSQTLSANSTTRTSSFTQITIAFRPQITRLCYVLPSPVLLCPASSSGSKGSVSVEQSELAGWGPEVPPDSSCREIV